MVHCIAVGVAENTDLVKNKLMQEFKILEGEGIKVKLEENVKGNLTFFLCWLTDSSNCLYKKEDIPAIFKQYIACALADLILSQWEQLILKQILRENYYYFGSEEQKTIFCLTLEHINREQGLDTEDLSRVRRKSRILKKLLEFLRYHNQIIIEGFIRFRLKEYTKSLHKAVDKAVDDYLQEKEYMEFIHLLQYFIEIRKPHINLIHIVLHSGGIFRLYNEQKQIIKSDNLEEIFGNLAQCEVNYEDILFSVLISLAPRQIIFHTGRGNNVRILLNTLKKVFCGRVQECAGCDLCIQ